MRISALFAGLLAFALPAWAGRLNAERYAAAFCSAAEQNARWPDAVKFAVDESFDPKAPSAPLAADGKSLDIHAAADAAMRQCPEASMQIWRIHQNR